MSVRTATHSYSQDEFDTMWDFYGGQRCVLTLSSCGVHWSHILDAPLQSSNMHVSQPHCISWTIGAEYVCALLAFSNAYPQFAPGSSPAPR